MLVRFVGGGCSILCRVIHDDNGSLLRGPAGSGNWGYLSNNHCHDLV